ncbi:glycosyltransferase [Arcobacter sp. F2176]|uniref:glycosyltransferase family 2 protein n=1 Tax=Arcobacter sp. F2176 TaxID=2044511 RepID=UPI00100BA608|nr:glycosyltransferase [Arcobacter sp. F2176]RXJ79202.1 hypothetical protein CRU95_14975 [Arcobacter sp. F2176]
MSNPLVSIIMPAYNTEKYITDSINSILEQTYDNWELIIVDDCSTDFTKDIIKKFEFEDKRIKGIYLEKNGGMPSLAKNNAIPFVNGSFIAFLDSDDLWLKEKLECQVNFLMKNPDIMLCYTGGYWINKNGYIIHKFLPKYENGYLFKKMLFKYEINNQSVLIRKEALDNTIKFFNSKIIIGEDYNLFMHILAKYKCSNLKRYLIKYRIHDNAITKSKKRVSDGVLVTLKELNVFREYPLYAIITYLKAIRFKFLKKRWK